jgi:hypothetical protein
MVRFGAPSPKAFIEKLAANDAATTTVDLSASPRPAACMPHSRETLPARAAGNNALFKMKSYEYMGQIAEAMKSNTVARWSAF